MTDARREDSGIRLACSDFTWRNIPHEAVLDLVEALDFEGVDIGFVPSYTTLQADEMRHSPARWGGAIGERVSARGLVLADIYPIASLDLYSLALNHPSPNEQTDADAFFGDMLMLTTSSGASGMTIVPGMVFDEPWEQAFDRAVRGLTWRLDEAAKSDVALSIEPHIHSVVDTPEKVLALIDAVPGLQLTLDYGHFVQQGIAQEAVDALLPFVRHLHVRGGAEGVVQTRFSENTIDFGHVVDQLAAEGFGGWIVIEYVHDERPGCATCDVTQETIAFRDFLRPRIDRVNARRMAS